MRTATKAILVVAVMTALTLCISPADAARGVKKTGEHTYRGRIVSVHKKGNHEHVTIQTQHHKKKKGQKSQAAGQRHHHTFTVDQKTHIHGARGKSGRAALHQGEHVTIRAHHHHADQVTINHHHKKSNKNSANRTTKKSQQKRNK